MNSRKVTRVLLLFLAGFALQAGPSAWAQGVVRGTVTDSDSGLPLIGATIQLEGTLEGTVTNTDGRFSLPVTAFPSTLRVRHIGYRSRSVFLQRAPRSDVSIQLDPDPVQLGELVVSGEDPGVGIMRQVLEAKAAWRDSVSTSYAEVYTRFMLYREFDLVQVEESIGSSWWKARDSVREVVRARRLKPDRRERFLYQRPLPVPNFYDDDVVLEGTSFRSPLHPQALSAYVFRLTEQRSRDGRVIHDIAFSPSSVSMAGFVGTLAVEDSTFDVLSITARPTVDRIGPPPVLERTVRMEQRFVRRGGAMLPLFFAAEGWVRFGRAGVDYPRARYRQVSGLSLHATEVPPQDSLFASTRIQRDDPAVEAGAWLFDWNPGMIPLSEEEAEDIRTMREDRSVAAFFRPEGMLAQYAAIPVSEIRQLPPEIGVPDPEWLKPWVWFNRVDGWHIGLRPLIPLTRSVTFRPALAFDEAPDRFSWSNTLEWAPPGRLSANAGVERVSAISGVGSRYDRFLAGLATYAGYDDYFDYYDRARRWGTLGVRLGGVTLEAGASHEEHRSLSKEDDYEGWLRKNVQRENPPIDEGTLAAATVRLRAGDVEMKRPGLSAYADLVAEGAQRDLAGSDFGFGRWQGAVSVRIPTLMRRRAIPAFLRLDVVAGGGSEGVPVQRRGVLDVATGPVAQAVAFRSRRDARVVARRWLAVFWEHDFGSALAERMGFGETNLGIVVFGAHGTAWHGETTRRDEVGLAWSKPFNLPFRINLASRLNTFEPLVTVEYYGLVGKLFGR
ncbi:MAG: carboxypeptidase-like regulatory domain-containing protein [Rhodothermales bacterium]|nr:carboxypeptidase-like regulatory domain-containing protein [Rhodothermales bacterium]